MPVRHKQRDNSAPPEAPLTTHPPGRRCPECGMPLSKFNPGPICNPCAYAEWRRMQLAIDEGEAA
jgi:hypothetical protein